MNISAIIGIVILIGVLLAAFVFGIKKLFRDLDDFFEEF